MNKSPTGVANVYYNHIHVLELDTCVHYVFALYHCFRV